MWRSAAMQSYEFKTEGLYQRLKGRIAEGLYQPGSRLPPEVELATQLGVARGTLRQTLERLETERLIVRIRAKGTFVRKLESGLAGKKIIALLTLNYDDISNPTNYLLPGVRGACAERGANLDVLTLSHFRAMNFSYWIRALRQDVQMAGIVIFGGKFTGDEDYIKVLQAIDKPVTMVECFPEDKETTGFASVRSDYWRAWRDGILALKELGHRRIGFLGPKGMDYFRCHSGRAEDFHAWLREEGLYHPALLKTVESRYDDQRAVGQALSSLLALPGRPSAVMCYSDFYALGLYKAAADMRVKIPQDIAVMGFCGYPGCQYLEPSLSTVDLNYFQMGQEAVSILAGSDEWFPGETPDKIMSHQVVMRDSSSINRFAREAILEVPK